MNTAAHQVVLAHTDQVMLADTTLHDSWKSFFSVFPTNLLTFASVVGVGLLLFAIGKYVVSKARGTGGQGGGAPVLYSLIAGALLSAPSILGPALMTFGDEAIVLIGRAAALA
jgi:hypothetical protein